MEPTTKIPVKAMVKANILVDIPEIHLRREWTKKGQVHLISFEDLEQAVYRPGIQYMFKEGILYIEDMDVKVALGIEEESDKPTNIIVLTDEERKKYLTVKPLHELRELIKKIPREQVIELAKYAVEIEMADFSKAELLKTIIMNRDIKLADEKEVDKK